MVELACLYLQSSAKCGQAAPWKLYCALDFKMTVLGHPSARQPKPAHKTILASLPETHTFQPNNPVSCSFFKVTVKTDIVCSVFETCLSPSTWGGLCVKVTPSLAPSIYLLSLLQVFRIYCTCNCSPRWGHMSHFITAFRQKPWRSKKKKRSFNLELL